MKKNNMKKLFSAFAVLAVSASATVAAIPFAGCNDGEKSTDALKTPEISISTALGTTKSTASGTVYFVGPDARSNDSTNDGTKEHPHHINDLLGAEESKLKPGDVVYVLPGTYTLSTRICIFANGTFDKYIRIVNAALDTASGYTGEEKTCVLNFASMAFDSNNRGVQIYGNYIHWYGVDVCGAGDNGLYIGGSYNTVEYSEFYNNRDTGLQLGRSYSEYNTIDKWPSYNLVKDCTSHNNYDNETYGENADGFAAKLTVGYGNVFDGCIAYRNSDDGWDLYAKADSGNIGTVIMYNCVAFENGYLEYTRDECNKFYPTYKSELFDVNETSTNPYMTRDGDGNGFKLGGSVMEGDVIMYNCLSYANRMHGVTDNSNPGYIKVTGVTSYNNSAAIGADGKIAAVANVDKHSNIDVARQTYSYNTVNNVLSVRDASAKSLDKDNYRGSVANSLLDAETKTNAIIGSEECDTRNGGKTNTKQVDLISASAMFKKLPYVLNQDDTITYNLDGARNSMTVTDGSVTVGLLPERVHKVYRNTDNSINMGEILAQTDAGKELIATHLGAGVTAGSDLAKTSWGEYTHFYANDLTDGGAESEAKAVAKRTAEALTLNCDENAVYQDFEVPNKMLGADIAWSTTDNEYLVIGKDVASSVSGSGYITIEVYRDAEEDKQVQLTAKITYNGATETKQFTLNLKKGTPSAGEIYVVDKNGVRVENGGRYIVDKFNVYNEPEVKVKNGLYVDSEKLLRESEYDLTTKYTYQTDSNAKAYEVKGFTPSVAGVYTITNSVSIKGDAKKSTMTYKIYVASTSADVDFTAPANVSVYQNGYTISGEPSSATGTLYTLASSTELSDVTTENIKTYKGVVSKNFRDTNIKFDFENANSSEYYVYYALANANGEVTSEVYSAKISKVEIDTTDKFMTVAGGGKIGDEEPSRTIYALTADLDFTGVNYAIGSESFRGVLNGFGHTVANLTVNKGVFNKVAGGTIMNVKFDKFTLNTSAEKAGLVVESSGGYFYNIAYTNVNITGGGKRVAALIGHVGGKGSELHISQVSIVNTEEYKIVGGSRVAGLIGYVQAYENNIYIDNCYVRTDIEATGGESAGLVASWEDREADTLHITQCYYAGTLKTGVAPGSSRLGGMLGYHKGGKGKLEISRCISLAVLDIQGEVRTASVKNASPIVGNFSANAEVSVTKCIGFMQEYNSDYGVETFTLINLRQHPTYITGEDFLNLDVEERWTVVAADEADKSARDLYKAPYVTLNFLGNWN